MSRKLRSAAVEPATTSARRYRCTACGNLTRFDVTVTRTIRAFHHFTVGGELEIEDEEIVREQVDDVSCRWCGHGRSVQPLEDGEDPGPSGPGRD